MFFHNRHADHQRRRTDFPVDPSRQYLVNAKRLDDITTQLEQLVQTLKQEIESNE